MNSELSNLCLFFFAIAKVLLLTGLGPAMAIAILCDRVRAVGFEKVSAQVRGGQLAKKQRTAPPLPWATSSPRKLWRSA